MTSPANLSKRNVELLQATMRYVEEHPAEHNQEHWRTECGTAFCYAGHAALLAGATRPTFGTGWDLHWAVNVVTLESADQTADEMRVSGSLHIDEFAASQLGITMHEADALFDGYRTVAGLHALVNALCDGAWIDDDLNIHGAKVEGEIVAPVYVDDWLIDVGAEY